MDGWGRGFEAECLIHQLVEQRAAIDPEATAVAFADETISYQELNARANRLAHRLISLGVTPDSRVGVAMERSVEMIVALLGVLKAGAAYVPFDPECPAERLQYMTQDSGSRLLLTQPRWQASLSASLGQAVSIVVVEEASLRQEPTSNPDLTLHAEGLVYVIYTSGSTGRPKGVGNTHAALYNRLAWGQHFDALTPRDVAMQKTPFTFDISFWEIFWPLMSGATLVIAEPGAHRDPVHLIGLIRRHRVTTIRFRAVDAAGLFGYARCGLLYVTASDHL